ncbi:MAG: hypothetical protein JST87_15980 [Bacteroidetes bacterium]|nr:hypothetical protein [Bacteroidota bacterium]
MKKLLIIYPNWLPSNAVGVQRVRLIVNYLHEFGWQPYIVAVNPAFYEEELSEDLLQIVKKDVRVFFVDAKKARKRFRLYGDITLRAFGNLKQKAIEVCRSENINAIWVPIPPFYTALIGKEVHSKTNIPYGIDYIDPWVHEFPGGKGKLNRARFSSFLAKILEPKAVKEVSFITGVSEAYFLPVIKRNPHLKNILTCGMPYGFDGNDYSAKPTNQDLLWKDNDVKAYIYAGAFLPNAHFFIEKLFQIISVLRQKNQLQNNIHFYFIGTGHSSLNSITDYAGKYGLSEIIHEKKERIPYLEVLNNLHNAAGVLAIGSTEAHYTASKIFQAILSAKPVFAVFHYLSSVVDILKEASADNYLTKYDPSAPEEIFTEELSKTLCAFLQLINGWSPDISKLDKYSARYSAKALADILDKVS